MIEKVVIAAAGRGTRMGELTQDLPKQLLPVHGRPFISYLFDELRAAGLKQLIVVIGHKAERWTEFLATLPFSVTVVNQFERLGEKYGSACPIEAAVPEIGDEWFVSVNGDNLYGVEDLRQMVEQTRPAVAGLWHAEPERFGVLLQNSTGQLEKIVEKPSQPIGNLINTGLYTFSPEILPLVKTIPVSPRGEYELTDAISLLAKRHPVDVVQLHSFWKDFGRPEDIQALEKFIQPEKDSSRS